MLLFSYQGLSCPKWDQREVTLACDLKSISDITVNNQFKESEIVTIIYSQPLSLAAVCTNQAIGFCSGLVQSFPGGASGKEPTCQCKRCKRHKRHRFDPWVRKIPWRKASQPLQYGEFYM